MKLKLKFIGFDRKEEIIEVDGKKRYSEILEEIGINPETVIVLRGDVPVPTDDFAEEGEVKIVRVISGG